MSDRRSAANDPAPSGGEPQDLAPKVAMVVYGDLTHDSRVQREATTLVEAGYRLTIYCVNAPAGGVPGLDPRVKVVIQPVGAGGVAPGDSSAQPGGLREGRMRRAVGRMRWLVGYGRSLRSWGDLVVRSAGSIDIWHAHDFAGLVAIAHAVDGRSALVYDVHDLFVETGSAVRLPSLARMLLKRYERYLVRRVDLAVAVNQEIARVFSARCHPRALIVVHNCPPKWIREVDDGDLIRRTIGLDAATRVALYHGLFGANRGIERMCEMILEPGLEDLHLVLLGYGPMLATLDGLAREPRFERRIHILPAVAPSELLAWVESADVGLMPMPRTTLNLVLSTPNKLFECLASGVPVVVSDFPAVRRIVIDDPLGPLGATCDPDQVASIGTAVRELLELDPAAMAALRARCAEAALERWNWEVEGARLATAYAELAVDRAAPTAR